MDLVVALIMSLAELDYIEKALDTLKSQQIQLEMISKLLKIEFTEILNLHSTDHLNIVTRVKGEASLKEKILRRSYYKKYNDPKELIYQLSDLIGVRIECRFQQNEYEIYDMLTKHFNTRDEYGHYYNELNPNVKLCLDEKQPEKQNNGFKIFRIDGYITDTDTDLPFELQIKSLVNTFWSEVEHKIIYKNYSFLMMDELLTEMLHSIKNSLSLLDKQLLSIYQNVEQLSTRTDNMKHEILEAVLSRLCNDVFSQKLKEQMGFNINIKKDIQTLVNYTFLAPGEHLATVGGTDQFDYILTVLERISNLANSPIQFNVPIQFESEPVYRSMFAKRIGPYLIEAMNKEFHWNLFFKMLMEIEPQNNVGDFEKFIGFLELAYQRTPSFFQLRQPLYIHLGDDAEAVLDDLMQVVAECMIEIDDIECIYAKGVEQIGISLAEVLVNIIEDLTSYDIWLIKKEEVLSQLREKIINSL